MLQAGIEYSLWYSAKELEYVKYSVNTRCFISVLLVEHCMQQIYELNLQPCHHKHDDLLR